MEGLGDAIMGLLVNVALAAAILYLGHWLAKYVTGVVRRHLEHRGVDPILATFGANVAYVGLLAFVIIAALGQVGIQTTSMIAILGAAGLAAALAFQGSLSNLASGVLLVSFRPFAVGDFVEAGGSSGVVEKIEIFTTQIKTGDNKTVIIPNAVVTGASIVNYSAKPTRRIDLVFGVGYADDLDTVRTIIESVLAAYERILEDPAPTVGIVELADNSVNFAVRPWVNSGDYWPVHFDLHETFKKRFDAEGINIPYPQRDVHLHQAA